MLVGVALVGLSLLTLGPVSADSWPGPQIKEVFSESREWFVRVTPSKSIGETYGFYGSPKGKHATAEFYRRAADRSYLEPETGRWQYCEWRTGKHQCRDSNTNRIWRGYQEPPLRK